MFNKLESIIRIFVWDREAKLYYNPKDKQNNIIQRLLQEHKARMYNSELITKGSITVIYNNLKLHGDINNGINY